jgi:beta-glucosidase/6-phospho-beta-glucosidase/beta-galactosidase
MKKFMFATGIENSYPTIVLPNGKTKRVDEMEKANHYALWKEDFRLVKETGIEFLRYGPPYYSTHLAPGKYDWSFTDETFAELKRLGITPLVDLCHFGVPDWIGNFQNKDFPKLFAEYAKAFAIRFPDLVYYTPINEIFITAMFSGQYGWWNERLSDEKSFVTALTNCVKAAALAMEEISKIQPNAIYIHSESCEYFHAEDPSCQAKADFLNEKRFLSLDLLLGHKPSNAMRNYLLNQGVSEAEYNWFFNRSKRNNNIIGNDYYYTNEHMVHSNGMTSASGDIFGYYVLAHQYYRRYQMPMMHTETNMKEPRSVEWLKRQWTTLYKLKLDGIPVCGFTWYSLIDQVDWDTALREDNGNINSLGLYDMDRKIRPVGEEYKKLIGTWTEILNSDLLPSVEKIKPLISIEV